MIFFLFTDLQVTLASAALTATVSRRSLRFPAGSLAAGRHRGGRRRSGTQVVVVAPRPVSWSGLVQRTRVVAAVTVAGRTVPTAEGATLAQARAFGTRLAFTFRAYVDVQPCRLQHCSFEKKERCTYEIWMLILERVGRTFSISFGC